MSYPSAPTRTLPEKANLAELQEQAKELLESYKAGKDEAVAEVERFERNSLDRAFALADAQRMLARAYGFSSWPALENHVDGVNFAALLASAEAGDVAAHRRRSSTSCLAVWSPRRLTYQLPWRERSGSE